MHHSIVNFFFILINRELNNEAALSEAKRQVEAWYPVVGVLEEVNITLAVLQHHLPHYFAGVLDLYHTELLGRLGVDGNERIGRIKIHLVIRYTGRKEGVKGRDGE